MNLSDVIAVLDRARENLEISESEFPAETPSAFNRAKLDVGLAEAMLKQLSDESLEILDRMKKVVDSFELPESEI